MSEQHREQITKFYEGRLPFTFYGTEMKETDWLVGEINPSAWTEIPDDDVCLAHWRGSHDNQNRGAEIFITDRAIHIIHTGTFRRKNFLGSERILPSTITGVERKKASNSIEGLEWTVTISRTTERDSFSNLDEFTAKLLEDTINGWKGAPEKAQPSQESPADTLLKLKQLMDAGVLTEEEFEAKKKKLLDSI